MKDYFNREIRVGDAVAIAGKVPGNYGYSPSKLFVGIVKKITKDGKVKCKVSKYGQDYTIKGHSSTLIIDKKDLLDQCPWLLE